MLSFVSLQGGVGPPGGEGEQGQEGIRVSDCKLSTFLQYPVCIFTLYIYFSDNDV